jgi:hypothetical protein
MQLKVSAGADEGDDRFQSDGGWVDLAPSVGASTTQRTDVRPLALLAPTEALIADPRNPPVVTRSDADVLRTRLPLIGYRYEGRETSPIRSR